eukprot:Gb_03222 [translate_table: standard]
MAHLLRNQKNMMVILFLSPRLPFRGLKATSMALKKEGNANYCFPQDVKMLCEQNRLNEALGILHVMDTRPDSPTYVCLLRGFMKKKAFSEGKLVHAHMTERGFRPDRFVENTLLYLYAKCGSLAEARRVFDQMVKQDGFSWTVMIAAYARHGPAEEAVSMFYQMQQTGIRPDRFGYASVLSACANLGDLQQGKEIHDEIMKIQFQLDVIVWNALIDMYAKCGSIENARHVFDEMPQRNIVSWNAMIAGYAQNEHIVEALKLFNEMPEKDAVSWNTMIAAYAHNGHLEEALTMFKKMPARNIISWTAVIAGCAQNGHGEEALKLFRQMKLEGVKPNSKTFASVLPACADMAALEQGMEIHEEIIRSGFQQDVFVESSLVDMYAKCGSMEKARDLFDKMHPRNTISWTAMIVGYVQNGHVDEALKLFQKMPERDVVSWTAMITGYAQNGFVNEALKLFQEMPDRDVVSWNAMIAGYVQNGHVDEALKLFEKMPKPNMVSWNVMISGYTQKGNVDEALKLFQKMPERNAVAWTVMIGGYVQNGHDEEALKFFRQMKLEGVKPDSNTFASLLPACGHLAALEQGMEIHEEIVRSGIESDMCVANALVDMYAKCGSIENGCAVFDKMLEHDVVSWTVMIGGYAMHGCGKEAIELFEKMQHSGMKPNRATLVCVLSACCHAGLVEEGRQYFDSMRECYHITPAMEHYGCMVDILGRAGYLDEAQNFINKMPIKPDATVWGCLLGACRIHNNIELGEHVAAHLFDLDPENAAHYVLLSNIYASAGKRDDSEKIRKMMKDRRVKKKPGCSWIEVNKQVHTFLMGDRLHPQTHEIYAKLER